MQSPFDAGAAWGASPSLCSVDLDVRRLIFRRLDVTSLTALRCACTTFSEDEDAAAIVAEKIFAAWPSIAALPRDVRARLVNGRAWRRLNGCRVDPSGPAGASPLPEDMPDAVVFLVDTFCQNQAIGSAAMAWAPDGKGGMAAVDGGWVDVPQDQCREGLAEELLAQHLSAEALQPVPTAEVWDSMQSLRGLRVFCRALHLPSLAMADLVRMDLGAEQLDTVGGALDTLLRLLPLQSRGACGQTNSTQHMLMTLQPAGPWILAARDDHDTWPTLSLVWDFRPVHGVGPGTSAMETRLTGAAISII